MTELTVRRDGAPDVTGDTVRLDGDELVVLGTDGDETVSLEEARSVIAGRPVGPSDEARSGAP